MGIGNVWPFNKDPHAQFEALVRPHLKHLYHLAYRFTGQRDDAEDLVQDLLLKLFPRLEEMQAIEKLGPWLSRILYRQFVDLHRKQQRSPIHLIDNEEAVYETHASDMAGPSDTVNAELTQNILNQALEHLTDDQRALVMLHDVEGYSLQEINQIMDIPVGTIKSRLSRSRAKLREILHKMEPKASEQRVKKVTG